MSTVCRVVLLKANLNRMRPNCENSIFHLSRLIKSKGKQSKVKSVGGLHNPVLSINKKNENV